MNEYFWREEFLRWRLFDAKYNIREGTPFETGAGCAFLHNLTLLSVSISIASFLGRGRPVRAFYVRSVDGFKVRCRHEQDHGGPD